jgi:hypothetical protein
MLISDNIRGEGSPLKTSGVTKREKVNEFKCCTAYIGG